MSPWVSCPYCEDQYRQGDQHALKDCIMAVLRANQWGVDNDDEIADDVIDVLQKRGTVSTQEQLDALPFLAVIREVFRVSPSGANYGGVYERRTSGWECIAGVFKDGPDNGAPRLPCRVLYPPEVPTP